MTKQKDSTRKPPRVSAKSASPPVQVAPKTARRSSALAPLLTLEERYRKISEAAYFRAQARGFVPGHEVEDWLAAERDVELELRN
jgi:hypothetical protein